MGKLRGAWGGRWQWIVGAEGLEVEEEVRCVYLPVWVSAGIGELLEGLEMVRSFCCCCCC